MRLHARPLPWRSESRRARERALVRQSAPRPVAATCQAEPCLLSPKKRQAKADPAPSAPRLRPRAPRQVRAHGQGRAEEGTPQIRRASQGRRHRRHGRLCGRGHVVGRLQGRAPRSTESGGSIRRSSRRRRRREPRSTTSTSAGETCATDGCAGTDTASPLRTSRRPQGSSSHAGASRRECTGATTTPHASAPSSPDCVP